jgi:hypothetical protein
MKQSVPMPTGWCPPADFCQYGITPIFILKFRLSGLIGLNVVKWLSWLNRFKHVKWFKRLNHFKGVELV